MRPRRLRLLSQLQKLLLLKLLPRPSRRNKLPTQLLPRLQQRRMLHALLLKLLQLKPHFRLPPNRPLLTPPLSRLQRTRLLPSKQQMLKRLRSKPPLMPPRLLRSKRLLPQRQMPLV